MKRLFLALGLVGVATGLYGAGLGNPRMILTAEIRGTINPASSDYLTTVIREAERRQAEAIILELDTPGGLVSSVREMVQTMGNASVPVVIYTAPAGASATSAGALLMIGSHVAAMAPGTNIGAAHPVGSAGEDIPGVAGEKATNDTAAFARSVAALKGRNAALAEEVVLKSKSLTAEEALKQHLIEVIAPTREELLKQIDGRVVRVGKTERPLQTGGASLRKVEMTWGQTLLHYLANPNVAGLLMTIGLMLIYIELSTPGLGFPGILGGVSILIALMSLQLLPIRAGGLILLLAGAIMLLAEPFVTSHGALAVGGILAFVLGMIWVIDPSSTSAVISKAIWIPAAIGLGGLALLIAYAAARMQLLTRKALKEMGGGGLSGLAGYVGTVQSIEEGGLGGKALFRGEVWNFKAEEAVHVGDHVEAVGAEGMAVQVRRAHQASDRSS